jgi:hypothetical protein
MTEDEKFFAWLDGELTGEEAAEMKARVAADPQLTQLAEQHRALGTRLTSVFDPVAAAPVPEHLRAALRQQPARVVELAGANRARSMSSLPQWAAMAATLAAGIVVGTMVPQRDGTPVQVQGGRIYASAALDQALDTELASAPSGKVRIGVTFRDRSGSICRGFTGPLASGLACRSGDRWQVRGLFAASEGQSDEYRMAGGMNPNLAALIDSTIAGEPFDAASEKAARQRGWR